MRGCHVWIVVQAPLKSKCTDALVSQTHAFSCYRYEIIYENAHSPLGPEWELHSPRVVPGPKTVLPWPSWETALRKEKAEYRI